MGLIMQMNNKLPLDRLVDRLKKIITANVSRQKTELRLPVGRVHGVADALKPSRGRPSEFLQPCSAWLGCEPHGARSDVQHLVGVTALVFIGPSGTGAAQTRWHSGGVCPQLVEKCHTGKTRMFVVEKRSVTGRAPICTIVIAF